MKTPGPFTRCGTVSLEGGAVKVTYDADGGTHTVFIPNARDLRHNRDAVPMPVFSQGPEGFIKAGYAHRSLSGRAFMISTTTSGGELTIEQADFQRVLHQDRQQVPVFRLNTPSV